MEQIRTLAVTRASLCLLPTWRRQGDIMHPIIVNEESIAWQSIFC